MLMKRDRLENYQWMKFFEHWGKLLTVLVAFIAYEILMFFKNLNGTPWIYFFVISFTAMLLGAALITFAKFPTYRSGLFFTFGIKSVPEHLIKHYKWGWRLFLFGMILSFCLFLSNK
jgi:hypothetical protein